MPTDKDYEELYYSYMFWVIDYDNSDLPVYSKAADILLEFLQKHCSHPCIFLDYQLGSLTHFIKEVHKQPIGLNAFQYLVEKLLMAANKGLLADTRIVSN